MKIHSNLRLALMLLPSVMLAACSDSGSNSSDANFKDSAVIATRTSSYDSGAVSLVGVDAPYTAQNNLPPNDTADLFVRSGGDHYFVIKRYGANQIVRFESDKPTAPTYTYSTNDAGEEQSNPSDLIVVSETKAYLLRYGSGQLWIVNPSATTEAAFKTGEIDLSQYDTDGVPQMTAGLLKNGKLYVLMQRLDDDTFADTNVGYVAVIDASTDKEITTGSSSAALKGIALPVHNPSSIVSVPGSDNILVVASGGYGGAPSYAPLYDGGLVSISSSYVATLVLDDGDATTHPYGQFGDVAAVAGDRAYLVGSAGFSGKETLYRFNPGSSAPAPLAVTGYGGVDLGALGVDPSGNLWVGQTSASAPGVSILGYANGAETTIQSLVDTNLIPINIDFVTVPVPAT